MAKMAERALIISFVLMVCVLLIGSTLVTADESVKSFIAKEDDLLGKYEKSDKIFKISNLKAIQQQQFSMPKEQ